MLMIFSWGRRTVNGWCGCMWWEEINEWHGILDLGIEVSWVEGKESNKVRVMIAIFD